MISYQEALSQIKKIAEQRKMSVDIVSIEDSVGRTLAEDLYVRESQPQFNLSAMDGFAVKIENTQMAKSIEPVNLEVLNIIAAGDAVLTHEDFSRANVAVEIMTGAVVPPEFNAVVRVEDTARENLVLKISRPLKEFENIRLAGSDFNKGKLLISKGTRLAEAHIMGLAAQGFAKVPVVSRPRVAIVNTGKEIVPYQTEELEPGQIRNSSGPLMCALTKKYSCDLFFYQQIPDEPKLFFQLMQNLLAQKPDVILTTGAVSMGVYDFIKSVLTELQAKVHFHKVAIRPGKPLLFASYGETTIFSIPGNPISTAVAMRFFVEPYLRMIQQEPAEVPLSLPLAQAIKKPEGFTCFYKAKIEPSQALGKVSQVSAALDQGSAVISSFLQSQYWLSLKAEKTYFEANEVVDVYALF